MAVISRLSIVLGADTQAAMRDLSAPTKILDRIESAADKVNAKLALVKPPDMAKGTGGADPGAAMGAQMGAQIGLSLAASLTAALPATIAPIESIAARMGTEFNTLGGTLTTLAKRLDVVVRADFVQAQLKRADVGFKLLSIAGAVAATKIAASFANPALLAGVLAGSLIAAPAFAKIASLANRAANQIKTYFTMAGSVTKKTLDAINHVTFKPIVRAAKAVGSAFRKDVETNVGRASASVHGFGREVLIALGVFGLGFKAVQFFRAGVKSAIDLNETLSKTKEVFGAATGAVTAQASEMAKAFGLNKQAMLDGASSIGLIAKAAGQTDAAAGKMANTMVRLAADAESFQNIPFDETLGAIRSGLVGQSEPLLRFGILMNESAVKAEALRMGLSKGKKELDDRTKVVVRAALIERGLATASGDLARTQDSAANQFRKAGGGINNFATTIGTALLPAVTVGITAFNDLASSVIEAIESNIKVIEDFAAGVKAGFDTVGVVIRNFGLFWDIAVLKTTEAVANILAVMGTIPGNAAIIGEYLANNWVKLIRDAGVGVLSIFENIGKNVWELGRAVVAFLQDPTQGFQFNFTPLLEGFKATADALPELIKPALISMQSEIDAKAAEIADREAKRAEKLTKIGGKRSPLAAITPEGPTKFAGALEMGSKEARSAILEARGGRPKDDAAKETAKHTRATAEGTGRSVALLESIAATFRSTRDRAAAAVGDAIGAAGDYALGGP